MTVLAALPSLPTLEMSTELNPCPLVVDLAGVSPDMPSQLSFDDIDTAAAINSPALRSQHSAANAPADAHLPKPHLTSVLPLPVTP